MSVALAIGIAAAFAFGFVDVAAAIAGRRLGSLRTILLEQFGSLVGLALFALLVPNALGPLAAQGIVAALPLGLISSVAFLGQFTALALGPVAVASPVIGAYGGVTVVLAVLLRGETMSPGQVVGAVLATAGVVLTGVVFRAGTLRSARLVGPGVLAAVVSAAAYGAVSVLLAEPIGTYGSAAVIAGNRMGNFGATLLLFVVVSLARPPVLVRLLSSAPLVRRLVLLMLVAGIGDMAGFLLFGAGLGIGPVWLVGLVSSFGPVLGIVYGVVWLRERLRPTQWIGMVLIGVSLVVLALA